MRNMVAPIGGYNIGAIDSCFYIIVLCHFSLCYLLLQFPIVYSIRQGSIS